MLLRIALFLSLCLTQCWGQTCDAKRTKRIDETYGRLMIVGADLKLPENESEWKQFCNRTFVDLKEVEEHKNECLKQRTKQFTGIVIFNYRNAFENKYCKNDIKRMNDIFESVPCMNAAMKEAEKCYYKMLDNLIGVMHLSENLRLPHICCDYYSLFECCKRITTRSKKCTPKDREFGLNYVREVIGKIADLMCNQYTKGSEMCRAIGETPKKKKGQKRTKSFMIPLIDAVYNLRDTQIDNYNSSIVES